jgi:dephospho-CoA kinase
MITVAVTGGIGSGKSTVSAALRGRGAVVVDSDQLAREVVAPGTPGLAAIAERFGTGMITADGALDRAALASVVFADPAARAALEGITHPLVRAGFAEIRRQAAADARARMAAQLTDDERAPLCDVVLVNHGGPDDLVAQVDELWANRLVPFERNTRLGQRAPRGGPELVDHQPRWAADGRRLAARVSHLAGGARVDHIGSTAIPGMPAKDVLDLQLTVPSLQIADELSADLAAGGFPRLAGFEQDTPHPHGADPDPWHKRLHGNADPGQSLNLHVRVKDSPNWRWALLFRDWLIAEPAVAQEYLAVKRSVAAEHAVDATAADYAEAKEPWLAEVYGRGLAWARASGWSPDPS